MNGIVLGASRIDSSKRCSCVSTRVVLHTLSAICLHVADGGFWAAADAERRAASGLCSEECGCSECAPCSSGWRDATTGFPAHGCGLIFRVVVYGMVIRYWELRGCRFDLCGMQDLSQNHRQDLPRAKSDGVGDGFGIALTAANKTIDGGHQRRKLARFVRASKADSCEPGSLPGFLPAFFLLPCGR